MEDLNSITPLSGVRVNRKKLAGTILWWGEIDPATDKLDETVQLFEAWHTELETLEHQVGGIRVTKRRRK